MKRILSLLLCIILITGTQVTPAFAAPEWPSNVSVEAEGADAVSLINTLVGMRIDIESRRPILHQNTGGLSGPAVFPVALAMVWKVANAVKIPVVGLGGVEKWQDAIEMMLAGATGVQVGTAMFYDPYAPLKIIEGMNEWLDRNGIADVGEIIGQVRPW